jgi:hypothetical protein
MKKLLLFGLAAVVMLTGCASQTKNLKPDQAKERAGKFINAALMRPGTQATVTELVKLGGLYKMKIDIGSGDPIDSYLSLDGKLFFPQAMDIDVVTADLAAATTTGAAAATVGTKNDKPVVELFVMSYCPYGLQMERGILPVVEQLGAKIDFKLKFCDYAMHEKKEIDENLAQYCLQKEQNDKFASYLNCFIQSGVAADCYQEAKINEASMQSCISKADKEFGVTTGYDNKEGWTGQFPPFNVDKADNTKYSVQGSPTLIINGQEISASRDSASLLTTICSAFNSAPEECSAQLSSTSPAAGFAVDNNSTASGSCQ